MSDSLVNVTDTLLDKDNIMELCPSLVNTPFIQGGSLDVSYNFKNDSLLHYQKLYYDKIEQGNRYMEELESIEKNYLTRKYGQKIYNYLMNQRSQYINKITTSNCPNNVNIVEDISFEYNVYKNMKKHNLNENINLFKSNMKSLDKEINLMMNKENNNKRKTEYIQDMSNDVNNTNLKVNIIYYFILLCLFIYLYVNNKIQFNKHKFLYIIVILFPFIYPFIYELFIIIYMTIQKNILNQGPEKGFLNENEEDIYFFDDTITQ